MAEFVKDLVINIRADASQAKRELNKISNGFWWYAHGPTVAVVVAIVALFIGVGLGRRGRP